MKPVIAIPIGDPAGIGPEITAKALSDKSVSEKAVCIVIGDRKIIENAMKITGCTLKLHLITSPSEAEDDPEIMNFIDLGNIDMDQFTFGKVSPMCGRAAYEYIEKAITLANAKEVDAVTTTCINKESLKLAGVPYIGHTEIFGALTHTEDPLTMFEVHGMRIFFLSRHVSLKDSCSLVTKSRIKDYVKRSLDVLKKLGVTEGTMAIAGLNPHCGEHGILGMEEQTDVIPAVSELQEEGYPVAGPIGADSVFHLALQGKFNSVLSLYHDQGHIAAKTLDFERTISITGGMPILRTSVDHGTAFDIAGTGTASAVSLKEAIWVASKYALSFSGRT